MLFKESLTSWIILSDSSLSVSILPKTPQELQNLDSTTIFVSITVIVTEILVSALPGCAAENVVKAEFVFATPTVQRITVWFSNVLKARTAPSATAMTIATVVDATSGRFLGNAEGNLAGTKLALRMAIVNPVIVCLANASMD